MFSKVTELMKNMSLVNGGCHLFTFLFVEHLLACPSGSHWITPSSFVLFPLLLKPRTQSIPGQILCLSNAVEIQSQNVGRMCICEYMCVYIWEYMYICVYMYVSIYVCVYICEYTYVFISVSIFMCICEYMYECVYLWVYACEYICEYSMCAYIYICMWVYICIYIIYGYTHMNMECFVEDSFEELISFWTEIWGVSLREGKQGPSN